MITVYIKQTNYICFKVLYINKNKYGIDSTILKITNNAILYNQFYSIWIRPTTIAVLHMPNVYYIYTYIYLISNVHTNF